MGRRTEEMEEQPRKRRKKKKKFGYYLYAVMILILTIVNITLATFLLTYVQSITVVGAKYSTKKQVVDLIKEDPLTINSIYAVVKYKVGSYKLPQYLSEMQVGWDMPWRLKVTVTEKEIAGGILTDNAYVYFAEDGTIMSMGTEALDNMYVIEGIQTKKTVLYEELVLKTKKQLPYIINVSKELQKQDVNPDRVIWEENSMNLYFGDICVKLGKLDYDLKVPQIPGILQELEGEKGILHLEHFNETSSTFSFERKAE